MATLERAIAIAAEAHAGQTDKAGVPYILHPLRVMMRMETEDERVVAVLHDLVEDCKGWTFDRLYEGEGFSFLQASAIDVLTRRRGQPYDLYIREVSRNPLAARVKLADLADNLDMSRPSFRALSHTQIRRYVRAKKALEETCRSLAAAGKAEVGDEG